MNRENKQYESALAVSDGWIKWGGGECPVPSSEVVVVKFRDGRIRDPYRADGYSWSKNGRSDDIIAYRIHKPDIDSRAQYEADIAASDGWIDWHGGKCPVDSDAIVEVKYRKPNPYQFNNDRAGDFTWSHEGVGCDIIAYRLQQRTKSEQDCDDAAGDDDEADLNECIGQDIDVVNHPSHYTKGRIECIDAIDSATVGKSGIEAVCVANIIKYLYRYEEKNGLEDVKKAKWYINKLISELESN